MIRNVQDSFGDEVLQEAATRYGLSGDRLEPLEGYESLVFATGETVLKIHHDTLLDPAEHEAELDFMCFLADGGAPVPGPLRSRAGRLVETIPAGDGTAFLASALPRLPGHHPDASDRSPELFAAIGRLLATTHDLTRTYRPRERRRPAWYDLEHVRERAALLRGAPSEVARHIEGLYARLRALPEDEDAFGLVHGDVHSDNLLLDGRRLSLIDFGDCMYAPFAMDLGTALYYYRRFLPEGHDAPGAAKAALGREYCRNLLRGYRQVRRLGEPWLDCLEAFVTWRRADLYLFVCRLENGRELDDLEREARARLEAEIVSGTPPLALDPAWLRD